MQVSPRDRKGNMDPVEGEKNGTARSAVNEENRVHFFKS